MSNPSLPRARATLLALLPLLFIACKSTQFSYSPQGSDTLLASGTEVKISVSAYHTSRSGFFSWNASLTGHRLDFRRGSCGEGCRVITGGSDEGDVWVTLEAETPGTKLLELELYDHIAGTHRLIRELHFAEPLTRMTRDPKADPGTVFPMLVGMKPEWCLSAESADEEVIDLRYSSLMLTSGTPSFVVHEGSRGYDRCWEIEAVAAGQGHLGVHGLANALEYFPSAVAAEEVVGINLLEVTDTGYRVPVDEHGLEERPLEYPVVWRSGERAPSTFSVELITRDGRKARGGAAWLEADVGWAYVEAYYNCPGDGQLVTITNLNRRTGDCLRGEIGSARVELPMYYWVDPAETRNPCTEAAPEVDCPPPDGGVDSMDAAVELDASDIIDAGTSLYRPHQP